MALYVYRNNQVEGPFDELVIQQALANGTMSPDEQVCKEGAENWQLASKMFPAVTFIEKAKLINAKNIHTVPIKKLLIGAGCIFVLLILVNICFSLNTLNKSVRPQTTKELLSQANAELDMIKKRKEDIGKSFIVLKLGYEANKSKYGYVTTEFDDNTTKVAYKLKAELDHLDERQRDVETQKENLEQQLLIK